MNVTLTYTVDIPDEDFGTSNDASFLAIKELFDAIQNSDSTDDLINVFTGVEYK